jgi:hypothetical protein
MEGDQEILSSVEVLLQNLITEYGQGEFGGKLEIIRDTWLDRVIARGIESYRNDLWEPNISFNSDIQKWSLQSIPISYKWYHHIKKIYDVQGVAAIEIMLQPCEVKYNTEREAKNAFESIVKHISTSAPDTVAEKVVLVKYMNEYYGKVY